MDIRLSPSGPVITKLSRGAVIQSAQEGIATFTNNRLKITDQEVVADMLNNTGEQMRPTLVPVNSDSRVRAKVSLPLSVGATWTTNLIDIQIEVSRDGGSNWVEMGTAMTVNFPNGPNMSTLLVQAADLQVAAIPNYEEGDTLTFRTLTRAGTVTGTPELLGSNLVFMQAEELFWE